jgi:hypothetical protein
VAIKARYKGDGTAYLNGVPARNLSDEEYDALETEQKAAVRKSGLYDVASETRATEARAVEPKKGEG